ncbi:hypothetical protein IEN91_04760 [Bacillus velezensis]|uniref:hypothetical protein n=1 Tax=Bacillus velezensis TaxID=492670 RepID=UPI0018C680A4|nr:hypothetical protein [Bacillus velezensis]QPK89755.1 hypothetical protein IEN91_04760 [Bacillus velezensis]
MQELTLTPEVTYVFEYESSQYRVGFDRDNLEGRRYRNDAPTKFMATNTEYQEIKPALVGVRTMSQNEYQKSELLLYFLPDIQKYVTAQYSMRLEPPMEGGTPVTEFNFYWNV